MTNCGLWVNHKWVKTPLTPLTRTPVGWGASGTFLNGGAYALSSKTRHYEISAQWMGTQAEIASIVDEIDTGEPIYMTDPFSYANILPHWIAKPQAMTKDAPYFTAVRPTLSTAPVEDARNYIHDPLLLASGEPQWSVQSPATLSAGTITIPETFAFPSPLIGSSEYVTPASPGEMWTASVKILSATAGQYRLTVLFRNGSTVTGSVQSAAAFSDPGTYTVTATAPANTDRVQWFLHTAGVGPNRTLQVAEPMLTKTPGPIDFFTGNTPNTPTHQYAWAGVPHNSASIQYTLGENIVFTGAGTKTFTVSVPEPGGRFVWYGSGSGVTVNGISRTAGTAVDVPAGLCTIGMTGTDPRAVSGMVLSVGQEPVQGTPGQGYTQVQCTGVTVTGYSAPSAIDRVGLSATFIEVGGWR